MGWVRVFRSEPSRWVKKSWEGSCQSRKAGRKCRINGACDCWEQLNILWEHLLNAGWAHSAPLFLLPGAFPSSVRSASSSSLLCPSNFLACAARKYPILPSDPASLGFQTGKWGKRGAPHRWSRRYRKESRKVSSKGVGFIKWEVADKRLNRRL